MQDTGCWMVLPGMKSSAPCFRFLQEITIRDFLKQTKPF